MAPLSAGVFESSASASIDARLGAPDHSLGALHAPFIVRVLSQTKVWVAELPWYPTWYAGPLPAAEPTVIRM